MGQRSSRSLDTGPTAFTSTDGASPSTDATSPPQDIVQDVKLDSSTKESTAIMHRDNNKSNGKALESAPAAKTGKIQRRLSFYETVDASEILPHLVVGNLASARDEEFLQRKKRSFHSQPDDRVARDASGGS